MKFTEAQLELAFIELLQKQGIQYFPGNSFLRNQDEVLIKEDLKGVLDKWEYLIK
jgi:type I restriction enzyme R subunit